MHAARRAGEAAAAVLTGEAYVCAAAAVIAGGANVCAAAAVIAGGANVCAAAAVIAGGAPEVDSRCGSEAVQGSSGS
jgi:hypothetical protein